MKIFLLSFIVILLLGIFVFLGLIFFTDSASEETAVTNVEQDGEVEANDVSEKNQENDGEIEDEQEESKAEESSPDQQGDSKKNVSSGKEDEESKELSPAVELEKELNKQDIVVENVEYMIQDEQYKSLYPDMLSAIAKNNTNTDIRDITYAYVAWDRNGLPLRIKGSIDFSDGQYVYGGKGENVNVAPGETFGQGYGFEIDSDMDEVYTMKAIIVDYEGFNGEKWTNPLYREFKNIYEGKRLADIEGHEDNVYYRFGGAADSNNENEVENSNAKSLDEPYRDTDEINNIDSEVNSFITQYLNNLEDAYATSDFSLISDDIVTGTAAYTELRNNVANNSFPNLTIYSIDVIEVQDNGDDVYVEVRTDRTNDNLDGVYEFVTGYNLIYNNGSFKIEGYSDL